MECVLLIVCLCTPFLKAQLIPGADNILPNPLNVGEHSNTIFIAKLDEPEYQNVRDGEGIERLSRMWVTAQDTLEAGHYNADKDNLYNLYTRENPAITTPQVITLANVRNIINTNFRATKRTIYLIHGWIQPADSAFQTHVLSAILSVLDANVIVVDWTAGGNTINYPVACLNAITAGESIARFMRKVQEITGSLSRDTHIIGFSLGVHVAGIAGRNLPVKADYLTGLEAACPGWIANPHRVRSDDAMYTEFAHTGGGGGGPVMNTFLTPLGQVDFYPNGGVNMPGCSILNRRCGHTRSFYYFAESVRNPLAFKGSKCLDLSSALVGHCNAAHTLKFGGLVAKHGFKGLYYFKTNADPPFSKF